MSVKRLSYTRGYSITYALVLVMKKPSGVKRESKLCGYHYLVINKEMFSLKYHKAFNQLIIIHGALFSPWLYQRRCMTKKRQSLFGPM